MCFTPLFLGLLTHNRYSSILIYKSIHLNLRFRFRHETRRRLVKYFFFFTLFEVFDKRSSFTDWSSECDKRDFSRTPSRSFCFYWAELSKTSAPISAGIISLTFLLTRNCDNNSASRVITFLRGQRLGTISGLGIVTIFINNTKLSSLHWYNIVTDCLHHAPFDTDKINRECAQR